MIAALLLIPSVAAVGAFLVRWPRSARVILLAAAAAHAAVTARAWWVVPPSAVLTGWVGLDATGLLFLSLTSALFLACAVYGVGYLRRERDQTADSREGFLFGHARQATFIGCLLLFLATMTLVCVSAHLGLLWVALEATTLASAPLIYFHRHHRSLEATWKYLLVCSVGIALAMLGNFFVAVAASRGPAVQGAHGSHLTLSWLLSPARQLDPVWLKAGFILLLVGYGTKMGLAPMHAWLPDAHSEAPSMVSALLSGALLNCALLAILRAHRVMGAAGLGAFSGQLLTILGLVSLAVAAVLMIGQTDFKRMLAYSSVEHMGILALGVGVGGAATAGAMFHAVNHSLAKAMLFLLAGNVLAACRTKDATQIQGLLRRLPLSGPLWLAGFLAIAGLSPFGPFISELMILRGALAAGQTAAAVGFLLALGVIFVPMARLVLAMTYGQPAAPAVREPWWSVAPPLALAAGVLMLGLWLPPGLARLLAAAAQAAGGQ